MKVTGTTGECKKARFDSRRHTAAGSLAHAWLLVVG